MTFAVLAAGGRVSAVRAASNDARAPEPLRLALFDRTTDEGGAFGAEAARQGLAVRATTGDLGRVWMSEIEPLWRLRPAAIAGLTAAAPLFCLEYLGRDYGMGVAYRVEHAPLAGGSVQHTVTGHASLRHWADRLTEADARWPARAAVLAAAYPDGLRPQSTIELLDLAARPGFSGRSLYSWMLVPLTTRRSPARG